MAGSQGDPGLRGLQTAWKGVGAKRIAFLRTPELIQLPAVGLLVDLAACVAFAQDGFGPVFPLLPSARRAALASVEGASRRAER